MLPPALAGVLGILVLPVGLLNWHHAEAIARFDERLDAIGSERSWDSVEPADWKVALHRYAGMVSTALATLGIVYWITASLVAA
ncbi:hypothetical protein GCM10028857_07810 [Salinarchaeum chitinilyticum]